MPTRSSCSIAAGSPNAAAIGELMAKNGLYADMWRRQQEGRGGGPDGTLPDPPPSFRAEGHLRVAE